MLLSRFIARFVCNIIGYAYPIYASARAVQGSDVDQHIQWVVFWTVNACFSVFETFADVFIGWFPFYYEAKVILMAWLALPTFQGATQLYNKIIAPSFVKYEQQIDDSIDIFKTQASDKLSMLCKEAAALAIKKGGGAIAQGQQYIVMQAFKQAWDSSRASITSGITNNTPPASSLTTTNNTVTQAVQLNATITGGTTSQFDLEKEGIIDPDYISKPHHNTASILKSRTNNTSIFQGGNRASASNKAVMSPAPPPPTVGGGAATRQAKEAELLYHFRILLNRGLKVRVSDMDQTGSMMSTMAKTTARSKSRLLRLSNQLLLIESKTNRNYNACVKLLIFTLKYVYADTSTASSNSSGSSTSESTTNSPDGNHCFVIGNERIKIVLEVDALKTKELMVAGLRLVVAEEQKLVEQKFDKLNSIYRAIQKQHVMDRLIDLSNRVKLRY